MAERETDSHAGTGIESWAVKIPAMTSLFSEIYFGKRYNYELLRDRQA